MSEAQTPETEQVGTGPSGSEAAATWRMMRALVLDNERRREVCDALDLSFAKVKALVVLAGGEMTMSELASRLITDAPYATLLIDDLERRGLVERTVHPGDRRSRLVRVTATGVAASQRAEAILGVPPAALAALRPEELATLARLLERAAHPAT